MEMVQFHPTGMVWPERAHGTLATEAIRGEGGILLNSKGERFMKNYYPERIELGPRDVVARAIYSEIVAGRGTPHGGVWLDVTHLISCVTTVMDVTNSLTGPSGLNI
jgi:succinate dehydrogenase/fumarate reductase flavoprotein subunit